VERTLISFRLYPQTLPRLGRGHRSPHPTHTVHPTLFDLATPLERGESVTLGDVSVVDGLDTCGFNDATRTNSVICRANRTLKR